MPDMTKPGARKPSSACEDFIKSFERCRLNAYLPTPHDVPTIGWGSTGPDIKLGMSWTQAACDARFQRDLAKFAHGVDNAVGASPISQGQFDALVSLAYNIGIGALADSTLLKRHKALRWKDAAAQFDRWNKQAGKVLAGLTRRRAAERAMYEAG